MDYTCPPTWSAGPRVVHDSMLYVFHSGHASADVGGRAESCTVRAGEVLLVPEGVAQTVRATQGRPVHVTVIHLTARLFLSRDLLSLQALPVVTPLTKKTCDLSRRLCAEFEDRPSGWRLQTQAMATELVVDLIRTHGSTLSADRPVPDVAALHRLEPLLHWIEERFQDTELEVRAMAQQLGVSEMTLRRLFQRALTTSPIAYVNERRMDHACRALRRSDQSVQQIAYDSGFNDIAYFYRRFHRHTGSTPGEYRLSS